MTDKKEEWEIGASKDNLAAPTKPAIVDFARSENLVGTHLDGRFLIEKDLTEGGADAGGIGLVYLAKDLKLLGKEVVVKILQKAALANDDLVRKFRHEKEALIRLDHPNIVRILDSGTLADGNPFMVMDFIPGRSLRRRMNEAGALDLTEAAHLIESITDGLGVAHSQKILHRDIKPENIMLTPQDDGPDRVRLIDFGIARVEDSVLAPATEIPRGIGTILYIAPEQLLGKMEQTPAIDVYASAIVFYEMLTGRRPFQPATMVEMFEMQRQGVKTSPRELRPALSAEAEALLLSALDFDADNRPQNIRQFGRDLARALRGATAETGIVRPTSPELSETIASDPRSLAQTVAADSMSAEIETIDSPARFVEAIPDDFHTQLESGNDSQNSGRGKLAAAALILVLVLAVPGGYFAWKAWGNSGADPAKDPDSTSNKVKPEIGGKDPSAPVNSGAARELRYFLSVQKMRDGKPFGEPFRSSGQEIFENGYKFRLNLESGTDGFIYAFAEDKDGSGSFVYNVLYPTPKTNDGSPKINAGKISESGQNTFSGTAGTEIVWLIWTEKENNDLESARSSGFANGGRVSDPTAVSKLKGFIETNGAKSAPGTKDSEKQLTVVKGTGETVLHRVALEHR